jgi:hypothetical protein
MNGNPAGYVAIKTCAVSTLTLAVSLITGRGQVLQTNGASADAPALGPLQQTIQDIKNPFAWLSWGGDLRLRNEYDNNGLSLTSRDPLHAQDYFRFRGRVWATATLATNVTLNARVSAEPREWMEPATSFPFSPRPFTPHTANEGLEWRYGILDEANLKLEKVCDQPLTLTLGRQDIFLGDGWLVADGTPGDRSWTHFLDAARAVFDAREIKTTVDVSYVSMHAYPGQVVPTIGNSSSFAADGRYTGYILSEQDEQGAILNVSNNSIEDTTLGAFFIYKNNTEAPGIANGNNANIYTVGASVNGTPGRHWQYSVEGAYQCGSREDPTVNIPEPEHGWRPVSAYGANAWLSYRFNDRRKNELTLFGEFLSGDNPNTTGTDEMFDVLWGRWSRWSELSLPFYSNETSGKLAQLNNVGRFGPGWTFSPMKGMTFSAMYNALFAPEAVPTRAVTPDRFSLDGNFRGHYLQAVLRHQFSQHLSAHLWGECIWEGNYYKQQGLMTFLRAEVMLTF